MRTVAWIMVLVGTPIAVGAFYFALSPIAAMYQQAATDALSDAMPSDGKAVAKEMLVPAAVGVVFGGIASAGSLMLFVTKRRKRPPLK
jgi:hypothetical protein